MYDREVEITLGVLKVNKMNEIYDYIEKPIMKYRASMGIYVFEPEVLAYIPSGKPFDLPDLIKTLIAHNEPVKGCHFSGYWRDIGRQEDYEKAVEEFGELKDTLLGDSSR
jgi:NDP-sugar pyrophosphorylase family protein